MSSFYMLMLLVALVVIEYFIFRLWLVRDGDLFRTLLALFQIGAAVTMGVIGRDSITTSPEMSIVYLFAMLYFVSVLGFRRIQKHRKSNEWVNSI